MERSVSVNVQSDSDSGETETEFPAADFPPIEPAISAGGSDLGPCLYFGPAGQRCERRAIEGAFCARHQPGAIREALRTQVPRRAIAAVGLLAVLWPVLADLIRELIHWFR